MSPGSSAENPNLFLTPPRPTRQSNSTISPAAKPNATERIARRLSEASVHLSLEDRQWPLPAMRRSRAHSLRPGVRAALDFGQWDLRRQRPNPAANLFAAQCVLRPADTSRNAIAVSRAAVPCPASGRNAWHAFPMAACASLEAPRCAAPTTTPASSTRLQETPHATYRMAPTQEARFNGGVSVRQPRAFRPSAPAVRRAPVQTRVGYPRNQEIR